MEATPAPAVSWVCTWMGMSGNFCLRAPTNIVAAFGFRIPDMSYNNNGLLNTERNILLILYI